MNSMGPAVADLRELIKSLQNVQFKLDIGAVLLAIAAYVFMAIGLYAIAKKRCIQHPWLAWIPVANMWLLGCISDQYRYVTKNQERSRRKRMLTLAIIQFVNLLLVAVAFVVWIVRLGTWTAMRMPVEGIMSIFVMSCALLLLMLPLLVVAIWLLVERFCAYYDLFSSCNPENKTVFTVLSIVSSCLGYDILGAVFIFICRHKEEGMPPRIER